MGWRCGRWEVANRQQWFSPSGNGQSGVFCSRKCPQHVSAPGLPYVSCWAPPAGQGAGAPRVLPPPGTPLAPDGPSPGRGAQGGPDAWRSRGLGAEPSAPPCGQSGNCGVRPRAPCPACTLPSARPPHSTGLICTQRHPGPGIRLPPRGARSTTRANSESRDRMGSGVTDAKEGQGQERTVLGR